MMKSVITNSFRVLIFFALSITLGFAEERPLHREKNRNMVRKRPELGPGEASASSIMSGIVRLKKIILYKAEYRAQRNLEKTASEHLCMHRTPVLSEEETLSDDVIGTYEFVFDEKVPSEKKKREPYRIVTKWDQEWECYGFSERNEKRLRNKLLALIDQDLDELTLSEIKTRIYKDYQEQGIPLVLVEFPEQDLTDGNIEVVVTESHLDEVEVRGNRWSNPNQIKKYVPIRTNERINQNEVLKSLYLINQNPLRNAEIVFQPGERPYTTDLVFVIDEKRPIRFYVGADNTGIVTTGRQRWFGGFNWAHAFGLDHTLSYQYTTATEFDRFQADTVQYIAPLSWGHVLNIYGGWAKVEAKVTNANMKSSGHSWQGSLRYTIPVRFRENSDLVLGAGFDFKRTNNTVQFSETPSVFGKNVNLTQLVGTAQYNWQKGSSRIYFLGDIFWSPGEWLSDQSNSDYSSLRPGAKNQWIYARAFLNFEQKTARGFLFSMLFRGQLSSQNLLPSEQFGLGGYDTVRGYDQREYNGDNAAVFNASLFTPSISLIGRPTNCVEDSLKFLLFFDVGYAEDLHSIPCVRKWDYLMGAGPGIRYNLFPYISARFDWGIRLHKDDFLEDSFSRIDFSAIVSY